MPVLIIIRYSDESLQACTLSLQLAWQLLRTHQLLTATGTGKERQNPVTDGDSEGDNVAIVVPVRTRTSGATDSAFPDPCTSWQLAQGEGGGRSGTVSAFPDPFPSTPRPSYPIGCLYPSDPARSERAHSIRWCD